MQTGLLVMVVVLASIGCYMALSVLLFKFPTLIHKKKKLKFRASHISHRGGAGENLENTMSAFKHAIEQHTEMLEIDCHITRDGQVVVSHDGDLYRHCGVNAEISDLDYKDLPLLNSNLKLDFEPDHIARGMEDRRIPTLREVFTAFPATPINIDVKVHDTELMIKVNEMIKEFNREDLCIWGGRSSKTVKELQKLNPSVPTFFSLRGVVTLLLLYVSGLLPFIPLPEAALEVVMPSIFYKFKSFATPTFMQRIQLAVMDKLLMRPSLFKHLDKRGIHTYLWVLNNEDEFERAFRLGATGVMTDFPTKLREYLQKHPEFQANIKDF